MSLAMFALLACSGGPASAQQAQDYTPLDRAIAAGEAPKTTSVLVMRGGTIEHEMYSEGATADTLHDTRSVGKSITALAVGIAIEKGLLRTDTRVFEGLDGQGGMHEQTRQLLDKYVLPELCR